MAKPFYGKNMLTGERTLMGYAGRGAKSVMSKLLGYLRPIETKEGKRNPVLTRTTDIWREGPKKGERTVVWGIDWRKK